MREDRDVEEERKRTECGIDEATPVKVRMIQNFNMMAKKLSFITLTCLVNTMITIMPTATVETLVKMTMMKIAMLITTRVVMVVVVELTT